MVDKVALQMRRYLRKTKGEGLKFLKKEEEEEDEGRYQLEGFSASSYGPGGMDFQGTIIVTWGGDAVMWKSGRQGSPSLSTAESELIEALEGMIMGNSIDAVTQELIAEDYVKLLKVDNIAAVSLLTEVSGNWRTRHLRLCAAHVRWRLSWVDWVVETVPGALQKADIGTKMMSAPKLQEMEDLLNFGERQKEERQEKGSKVIREEEEVEKLLRIVMIFSAIQGV